MDVSVFSLLPTICADRFLLFFYIYIIILIRLRGFLLPCKILVGYLNFELCKFLWVQLYGKFKF